MATLKVFYIYILYRILFTCSRSFSSSICVSAISPGTETGQKMREQGGTHLSFEFFAYPHITEQETVRTTSKKKHKAIVGNAFCVHINRRENWFNPFYTSPTYALDDILVLVAKNKCTRFSISIGS